MRQIEVFSCQNLLNEAAGPVAIKDVINEKIPNGSSRLQTSNGRLGHTPIQIVIARNISVNLKRRAYDRGINPVTCHNCC